MLEILNLGFVTAMSLVLVLAGIISGPTLQLSTTSSSTIFDPALAYGLGEPSSLWRPTTPLAVSTSWFGQETTTDECRRPSPYSDCPGADKAWWLNTWLPAAGAYPGWRLLIDICIVVVGSVVGGVATFRRCKKWGHQIHLKRRKTAATAISSTSDSVSNSVVQGTKSAPHVTTAIIQTTAPVFLPVSRTFSKPNSSGEHSNIPSNSQGRFFAGFEIQQIMKESDLETVYSVHDMKTRKKCMLVEVDKQILKNLFPAETTRTDTRNVLEICYLATKSNNCLNLISCMETQEFLYYTFPYYGRELTALLRHSSETVTLDETFVALTVAQLSCALSFLHENRIIHCHVTPSNVFISEDFHVRLAGFTRSVRKPPNLTVGSWSYCGAYPYTAPEIARGDKYCELIDWWNLGVLMHECLFMQLPFVKPGDSMDLMRIRLCKDPLHLDDCHISSAAQDLIQRLLNKHPEERLSNIPRKGATVFKHPFFRQHNISFQDRADGDKQSRTVVADRIVTMNPPSPGPEGQSRINRPERPSRLTRRHKPLASPNHARDDSTKRVASNHEDCQPPTLHACVQSNDLDSARTLLRRGVWVDDLDEGGKPALYWAVRKNLVLMTQLLLEHDADPRVVVNNVGDTLAHIAILGSSSDITLPLINRMGDPNTVNRKGESLLYSAAFMNRVDIAQFLLLKGASVSILAKGGLSLLHACAKNNSENVMRLILEDGRVSCELIQSAILKSSDDIDENIVDVSGWTALHLASAHGSKQMSQMLIDAGANVNCRTPAGDSPLDLAFKYGQHEVARLLHKLSGSSYTKPASPSTMSSCSKASTLIEYESN